MQTITRIAAATAAAVMLGAPAADACQQLPDPPDPPQSVECRIDAPSIVVDRNAPFEVDFTIINYPTSPPYPPPFMDDLTFTVNVSSDSAMDCFQLGTPGRATPDPSSYTVLLDEQWSPFADDPTMDTRTITFTPDVPGDAYSVFIQACSGPGPGGCERLCSASTCIQAVDDPMATSFPSARFADPMGTGDAGAAVPFALEVNRNAYPAGVPLTVNVEIENIADPLDIFPLSRTDLTGPGVTFTTDQELITFECGLHFPCFGGVENVYHVIISDGPTVVWDSRLISRDGLGRSIVDRSPLARVELLSITDDGGDGEISVGERAFIDLRLYARNPYFLSSLLPARIEMGLPPDVTALSWTLHHHDNPMDTYDPTPTELAATGTVNATASTFEVDIAELIARFDSAPVSPPPTVFFDLFEVDLQLEAIPTTLDDLVFAVRVTGVADGNPKDELSPAIVIPVNPPPIAEPPNPIPRLLAVRDGGDVRLTWNDSVIDALHDAAEHYEVYRTDDPLAPYGVIDLVFDTLAPSEESSDAGAIGSAADHYYKVSAFNTGGDSGDVP